MGWRREKGKEGGKGIGEESEERGNRDVQRLKKVDVVFSESINAIVNVVIMHIGLCS